MRLNDKSLADLASSKDAIDKEGILYKKGELNRGFQKRWFVLKGNLLFYFEKRSDKQPAGVIILEDCNVEVCDTPDRYSFSISFTSGPSPRTYILGSDNEKVMENWMKAVTLAPYDYTRTVVRELQKRVNKLRANDMQVGRKDASGTDDVVASYDHVESVEIAENACYAGSQNFDEGSNPKLSSTGDLRPTSTNHNRASDYGYDIQDGSSSLHVPSGTPKARRTLQGLIRRTKSSENLHQVNQLNSKANSKSPLFKRKGREYQSIKRNVVSARPNLEDNLLDVLYCQDGQPMLSTFQQLHEQYSIGVWTKVKIYEDAQSPDM